MVESEGHESGDGPPDAEYFGDEIAALDALINSETYWKGVLLA